MAWMEILHIRSHSYSDREEVQEMLRQLDDGIWPDRLEKIELFTNHAWDGDLCIVIHWKDLPGREGKTPLGVQLAQAFSQFGQTNHTIWVMETGLSKQTKEST